MNKNDLINQYFNKAIEEMEMAETHSDKCKCCIAIAEFIAKEQILRIVLRGLM